MAKIPHTRSTSVKPLYSGDELPVIKRPRKLPPPTIDTIQEVKPVETPPGVSIPSPLPQNSTSTPVMTSNIGGVPVPLDESSLTLIQQEELALVRERRQQQKAEHEARLAGISKPTDESSSSIGEPPSPQVLKTSHNFSHLARRRRRNPSRHP